MNYTNWMEKMLRSLTLARPNALYAPWFSSQEQPFAGSDAGGERAAAFYSLIGSVKINGLDPELYLRTALAQIADHPSAESANCCHGSIWSLTSPEPNR